MFVVYFSSKSIVVSNLYAIYISSFERFIAARGPWWPVTTGFFETYFKYQSLAKLLDYIVLCNLN